MATLEETMQLIAEEQRKTEEAFRKLVEEHNRFSEELREFKEENRIGFEQLRKSLRKTDREFNSKWSRLVEALVNNQVVPLLQNRNIPITETSQNIKGYFQNRNYEFDIIAKNGGTLVVIEVKTTLRVEDVDEFLDELTHFKIWKPDHSQKTVLGAVAFLRDERSAAAYAAKKGLFTILATGSSATITNPSEFKPKEF